jgi:hypothetical protein
LSSTFFLIRARMLGLPDPIVSFPRPISAMFVVFPVARASVHDLLPVVLLLEMGVFAMVWKGTCARLCSLQKILYCVLGFLP